MNKFNHNFPNYDDDSDFNTNANSYYKDLGRKTKLIKLLAKRIWEYENTLNETLEQIEQRLTDYILENDTLMNERLENWDKRIDEMPEEMRSLFIEWLNDGTLEQIINDDVLGNKADKTYVDELNEEITTQLAQTVSNLPNAIKYFGAKGDGVTDDTEAIQAMFDYSADNSVPVVIPNGDYRTTQTIIAKGNTRVYSFNAKIVADHDEIGLNFKGGPSYNYVYNSLSVHRSEQYKFNVDNSSNNSNAHGVVIESRVEIDYMDSQKHQGSGFQFRGTTNLNKCIFNTLYAYHNGEHGHHFTGTQDDSSVWRINLYGQYNHKSGIFADDDFMGRHWVGFWYAESNGNDGISDQVHLGKLRGCNLEVYAERTSGEGLEIYLGENTSGLTITSFRISRDKDDGINNSFLQANGSKYLQQYQYGTSNGNTTDIKPFKKDNLNLLSNRSDRYVDYVLLDLNSKIVNRIYGDGKLKQLHFNEEKNGLVNTIDTDKTRKEYFGNYKNEIIKGNGTIDNPEDVEIGDIIEEIQIGGYRGGFPRHSNLILQYIVSNVSGGNVDVDIVLTTKNLNYGTTNTVKINSSGELILSNLAGTGNRQLMVDENGRLYTE